MFERAREVCFPKIVLISSDDCGFPNAFTTICLSSKECKCLCLIENGKLIAGGNNNLLEEMINELKVILEVMKVSLRKL